MRLKKFQANSMPEALDQIRLELGSDAVILHTKEITKGGWFGFFAKKQLEVTAAVDPQTKITPSHTKPIQPLNINETKVAAPGPVQSTQVVDKLSPHYSEGYPEAVRHLDQQLEKQEISSAIRELLKDDLLSYWYSQPKEKRTPLLVYKEAKRWFSEQVNEVPMGASLFSKKYMIFAGPTGVGKTTTIAKLAAEAALNQNKRVAILTTDTYRIAAIEQLKTYASILKMPIEVIYSLDDFYEASKTFADYDLILVDTAGRNFIQDFYIQELEKTIDLTEQASLFVVLSLTAKYTDIKVLLKQFKKLPVQQVIFTKKDETTTFGAMLNVSIEEKLGIAFITNGQNVPDDVLHVNSELVVTAVMEGITYDGSS